MLPFGEELGACDDVGGRGRFMLRRVLKRFASASSSLYGRQTAWMGSLACEEELGNEGRALSCVMTLFAAFGFRSCALMFFSCVLEMGTCGEATPPSSVSCPTMRERTTKADCFARRSPREGAESRLTRSVDASDAVGAAASCFSTVERGALDLRRSLN